MSARSILDYETFTKIYETQKFPQNGLLIVLWWTFILHNSMPAWCQYLQPLAAQSLRNIQIYIMLVSRLVTAQCARVSRVVEVSPPWKCYLGARRGEGNLILSSASSASPLDTATSGAFLICVTRTVEVRKNLCFDCFSQGREKTVASVTKLWF